MHRQTLYSAFIAIIGLISVSPLGGFVQAQVAQKSVVERPVVVVERPSSVQKFAVDPDAVADMFNKGLCAVTGKGDVKTAFESLGIKTEDTVGIKITTAGGPLFSTHKPLVDAICNGLNQAGVPPERIIIWDKVEDDMIDAEWAPKQEKGKPLITSVITDTGFDEKQFYVYEILGRLIWGDFMFQGQRPSKEDLLKAAEVAARREYDPTAPKDPAGDILDQVSNKSFYAKLVTQTCTKIINVPVFSDSTNTGLNGCLASLALGSVDNTRRFTNEDIHGDPCVPEILDKDFFRKKVVLHVMDALVAQFAGGPHFAPNYTHSIGTLYLSKDPVAIDTIALARVVEWRKEAAVAPLNELGSHVKTAATFGQGEGDIKKIKVIRLP